MRAGGPAGAATAIGDNDVPSVRARTYLPRARRKMGNKESMDVEDANEAFLSAQNSKVKAPSKDVLEAIAHKPVSQ